MSRKSKLVSAKRYVANVGKGSVRVGPLMALPQVLADFGVDAREVFEESGIPMERFAHPEGTISFTEADDLLRRAVARTRCAHFGLLVGQRAPAQSMGAVGYLMLSSETVGAAIEALVAHLNVHDRGAVVALRVDGKFAILRYSLLVPGLQCPDQIYGLSLAVGQGILRGLCGPQWRPQAVTFSFARPSKVEPYRQCFGVLPQFDSPESALIFPAAQLGQAVPSADAFLNKLMQERVAAASFASAGDAIEHVRRIVRASPSPGTATLASVCSVMQVHERTLKRQLAASGTTFRRIRDTVLSEAARELLQNTTITVGEVSLALGYTDPAAFTRAFQRWLGTTPTAWRVANRG